MDDREWYPEPPEPEWVELSVDEEAQYRRTAPTEEEVAAWLEMPGVTLYLDCHPMRYHLPTETWHCYAANEAEKQRALTGYVTISVDQAWGDMWGERLPETTITVSRADLDSTATKLRELIIAHFQAAVRERLMRDTKEAHGLDTRSL